ncbi:Ig-like domain-containing protein, partial [Vibrio parahaemolyticus]
MKRLFLYALSLCTVLLAGCNNGDDGLLDVPAGWAHKAVSLAVTPKAADVPVGLTQQLDANAELETGAVINVTTDSHLTWSSEDTSIATVNAQGLVTAVGIGQVTITAKGVNNDGTVVSDTAEITVTDAVATQLIITPEFASVAEGLTQAYTTDVLMSNQQVVHNPSIDIAWSSSDEAIAAIDAQGVAQALAKGQTTIKAEAVINGVNLTDTATLTVTDAQVTRLIVMPSVESVPVGLERPFTAELELTNLQRVDVTEQSTWATDDPGTALVSDNAGTKGIAQGRAVSADPANISASIEVNGTMYTDSGALTVTDAVLVDCLVTPEAISVAQGLPQQFDVNAIFSNGDNRVVTSDSATGWTSSDTTVAFIDNSSQKGLATTLMKGSSTITATVNIDGKSCQDTAELTVSSAVVTGVVVKPTPQTTPVGLNRQFEAYPVLSTGVESATPITNSVNWSSADINIAKVSNTPGSKGLATGLAEGSVTITATDNSTGAPISGSATLEVTPAIITTLQVTKPKETTPVGLGKQFEATAFLSDNTTQVVTTDSALSWSVDDPSIADISNAVDKGYATGLAVGSTGVNAALIVQYQAAPITGSATLNVTDAVVSRLRVEPPLGATKPVGLTQEFRAYADMSNSTTQEVTNDPTLSWRVDNSAIASITSKQPSDNGVATGITAGKTAVYASLDGTSFQDSAEFTVTPATITSLTVTPKDDTTAVGLPTQFTATANLTDGSSADITTNSATSWTSSDDSIVTFAASTTPGEALAVASGVVDITATVTDASTGNVTATDTTSLTVTPAIVTGLQVKPFNETVAVGLSQQYDAYPSMSDGTTGSTPLPASQVSWTTDPAGIATVDADGLATGVAPGSTSVVATGTTPEGLLVSDSGDLQVTNAVVTSLSVTPLRRDIPNGLTDEFQAIALLSDGVTQLDVTKDPAISWTPGDSTIIGVDTSSSADFTIATGLNVGTTTLTASGVTPDGLSLSADADITVTNAVVTALQVTPASASIPVGKTIDLTAMALMSSPPNNDVTDNPAVTWSSSDDAIATVTTGQPSDNGVVTGNAEGTATIKACGILPGSTTTAPDCDFEAQATITVTAAVPASIEVTPTSTSVAIGLSDTFTAKVTYTDGHVVDPAPVSWTEDTSGTIAVVDSVTGVATGKAIGSATITATEPSDPSLQATATLNVTAAVITDVRVEPDIASIAKGATQEFKAFATYSDGRPDEDISTDPATSWSTTDSAIAYVPPTTSGGSPVLAIGNGVGTVTVTATNGSLSGTADLDVTAAKLTSINVEPANVTVGVGTTTNLIAKGIYTDTPASGPGSDGTDITQLVSWTGHNPA